MYAHCLFCQAHLGRNEAVEAFPVGRRLAFDAARGRLWVVCPRCERWNLTPLDVRWEAVEEAERLFRGSRLRVSTEQVGLAKLPEGLELVRIGRPLRTELAAWRYGDQFGRRRRRLLIGSGSALGASALFTGAVVATGGSLGMLAGVGAGALYVASIGAMVGGRGGLKSRWVPDGNGRQVLIAPGDVPSVRMAAGGEGGWTLKVPYTALRDASTPRWHDVINRPSIGEVALHGSAALEVARRILPIVNGQGASAQHVGDAVRTLETLGGGPDAFVQAAGRIREWSSRQSFGDSGALMHLPVEARLALEMAAHEEQERRAMEGELAVLERAWQDAESIAAIADDLEVPSGVRARLAALRGGARPPGAA